MPVCRRTHENGTKTAEVRGLRFPEKRSSIFFIVRKLGTEKAACPFCLRKKRRNLLPQHSALMRKPCGKSASRQSRCPFHSGGNAAKKCGKASCRRAPRATFFSPETIPRKAPFTGLRARTTDSTASKVRAARLFLPSPLPFRPRRKRCGPTASGLSEDLPRKYEQVPFAPKLRCTLQSPVKNKAPGYGRPCRKKGMFGKQKGRRKEKDAPSKVERTREKDRAEARNGDGKISTPLFPSSPFGRENCARHIAGRL